MFTSAKNRCGGLAAPITLLALAACGGDARISELTVGISADSVVRVIGEGAPAGDATPNIYQKYQFLAGGELYDVLMYDPQNRDASEGQKVRDEELVPVVVMDGKLKSWGWQDMDDLTALLGLQVRAKPEAPPDTTPSPPRAPGGTEPPPAAKQSSS